MSWGYSKDCEFACCKTPSGSIASGVSEDQGTLSGSTSSFGSPSECAVNGVSCDAEKCGASGSFVLSRRHSAPAVMLRYAQPLEHESERTDPESVTNAPGATLMLRNIPYKVSQRSVLSVLRNYGFCRGDIDFFYAPIDFHTNNNLGYAFVNLRTNDAVIRFTRAFDGQRVHAYGWHSKTLAVCAARVQGLEANIRHFCKSAVSELPETCRPVLFDRTGRVLSSNLFDPYTRQTQRHYGASIRAMPAVYIPHYTYHLGGQFGDTDRNVFLVPHTYHPRFRKQAGAVVRGTIDARMQ